MRYIPLKDMKKDGLREWLKRANEILDELKGEQDEKKRKVLIQKYKSHWRTPELLVFLKNLSFGKCWYTEARFSAEYPHLEYFRPKSYARNEKGEKCHDGYWWLAFDLDNYRLSKPVPNTKKGTYFPLKERALAVCAPGAAVTRETPMFLDPTDAQDVELISFNSLGQPEPNPNPLVDLDDWDKQRIEFSIGYYGLDDQELCNQRKELWISLVAQFNEYLDKVKRAKKEQCAVSKGQAIEIRKRLKIYMQPSHEFTRLVKSCFESHPVGKRLLPELI